MIVDIIAAAISGILGAMGFGGGGVLIMYLSLYKNLPQTQAQGINLIFFIPSAILAVILHIKHDLIDKKSALCNIGLGLIGVLIGFILLDRFDERLLRIIFAAMLIAVGLKNLFFERNV